MAANPRPTDPEFSVLYLTHHLPFPPTSGGRRREYELLRRLGDEANIHALAITKTPEEDRRDRGRLLRHCAAVELFPARPPTHRRLPRQVARHHSAKGARRLRELLERRRLDLIHVEGFYLWPLLQGVPGTRRPPTVLVEHNVEHELWQQRAERAPREHRDELLAEAARTRAAELEAWREADQVVAVTERDREVISAASGRPVELVTDGFDHLPAPRPRRTADEPSEPLAVMVANFAYEPNQDSARWCLREIVPALRELVPRARVLLVGARPSAELRREANATPGVEIEADVESVTPYLDRAAVVICPLRIGGGIKVKVLEALARGKATVTTSVGCQGLEEACDRAVLVRDDARGFAAATAELLTHAGSRRRLERAALEFAYGELPSWDECAAGLLGVWAQSADRRAAAAADGGDLLPA